MLKVRIYSANFLQVHFNIIYIAQFCFLLHEIRGRLPKCFSAPFLSLERITDLRKSSSLYILEKYTEDFIAFSANSRLIEITQQKI